jgi:hypothetical protein
MRILSLCRCVVLVLFASGSASGSAAAPAPMPVPERQNAAMAALYARAHDEWEAVVSAAGGVGEWESVHV